jgi:hypothetical protein
LLVVRTAWLGALIVGLTVVAGARSAVAPLPGAYTGQVSTKVLGAKPGRYSMTVSHESCAPAGGGTPRLAWCVAIARSSVVPVICGDGAILSPFFPITERIALSPAGSISHQYELYYSPSTGQTYEHRVPGGIRIASFWLALKIDGGGDAAGTARFVLSGAQGTCDSGVARISATRSRS